MASPQLENGYTRIANEILEELAKRPFSGRENSILWVVVRMTYGFNRKEARIGMTEMARRTGILRQHCASITKELIEKKVLLFSGTLYTRTLGVNKDYDSWKVVPRLVTVPRTGISPKRGTETVPETGTETVPETGTAYKEIENNNKDKLPPVAFEYFIDRWNAFAKATGARKSKPWSSALFPNNRKEHFRVQMENPAFEWETILRTAYRTKFIRDGCKGARPWVTLDKLIQPRIWQRLLSGDYGEQTKPRNKALDEPLFPGRYKAPTS